MFSETKIYLRLAPVLLPMTVIVAGGVAVTFLQSVGLFLPTAGARPGLSAYADLFSSPWFYETFAYSVYVGLASAALSLLIGTVVAYRIWRLPLGVQRTAVIYKVPLVLPHLTVAFLILVLFSRSGFLSSLLYRLGIISGQEDFPRILFGGNGVGLIIAYVYKETPFVILMTLAAYKGIDERLIVTAGNLGAKPVMLFRRVVLPHLYPVMANTFIILFLFAFGAFDIPFLLSESRPQMLSIYVYSTYFKRDLTRRPEVMAALVIMFAFSIILIYLYSRAARHLGGRRRLA